MVQVVYIMRWRSLQDLHTEGRRAILIAHNLSVQGCASVTETGVWREEEREREMKECL